MVEVLKKEQWTSKPLSDKLEQPRKHSVLWWVIPFSLLAGFGGGLISYFYIYLI